MPRKRSEPSRARKAADEERAPLARYGEMRDFSRTPEPAPSTRDRDGGPLTFVVQKHRATRLHYDLRLEADGVMKSWPVPKGPSTDPKDRRLAVMTEDHPLDYSTFEGVIPKGEYGAGEVIVWDRGTYSPDEGGALSFHDREEAERRMREGIEAGKVSVQLRGHRMKGSWALVKTTQAEDSWLLLKHRDDAADAERDLTAEQSSVISGLTIADLQAGRRPPEGERVFPLDPAELPGARRAPFPDALSPMHAVSWDEPFSDERWIFEPKLDGVRAIVFLRDGQVTLRSRRGLDSTAQYPSIAEALSRQPAHTLVLDGEIVALDERGVPSFERLQQRMNLQNPADVTVAERQQPVLFYAFDLLYLDGVDLQRVPLEDRKQLLRMTLLPSNQVRLVEHFEADGKTAYRAFTDVGLEGFVAKRRDSRYEAGKRAPSWRKVKPTLTDDFVVCGYSVGKGARGKTFGSLVLCTRGDDGRLEHVGRVGSGFDERTLRETLARLEALRSKRPTVDPVPEGSADVTWVRPELVVEVEYAHYTADRNLRAPVFKRLRDDKAASEVVRSEVPLAPPAAPPATPLADEVASVLAQLEGARQKVLLEVEGQRIGLTNLDKVMWPAHDGQRALTKRDLIAYYARMAPVLLRHLRDRPLTMTRYPNGIEGSFFYQKHVEDLPGDFVHLVTSYSEDAGGDQDYILVNNLATLVWLGQIADLALHASLARVDPEPDGHHLSTDFTGSREQVQRSLLNFPDFILFDLDPYIYAGTEARGAEPELNRRAFERTCEVARWLKELLDSASLSSFVKTSGATGLHVLVPVRRDHDYETVREIASTLGAFLVRAHPREITVEWSVDRRTGKVFFDANQNARHKSIAMAYSPRTKPGAPVSMPLRWDELGKRYPTEFTMLSAPDRLAEAGDLWEHILDAKNDLSALTGITE